MIFRRVRNSNFSHDACETRTTGRDHLFFSLVLDLRFGGADHEESSYQDVSWFLVENQT